jgi:membrane protease YdiL (CAAX protease family)
MWLQNNLKPENIENKYQIILLKYLTNKPQTRRLIILMSPILILIIGNLAARLFSDRLGKWAWTGYFPVYWGLIFLFIFFTGKKENQRLWFRKSGGSRWWVLLAITIGLISFPVLLIPNIRVLHSIYLVIAWCLFSVINSLFEESYWRGFLLDETSHLPKIYGVIYSTILFTAIHPLNLGVFSEIQAFDPAKPTALVPFLIILIMLSLVYCLLYLKTKSLRLPIFSHILTDLGNLSVFLFMNMVHF